MTRNIGLLLIYLLVFSACGTGPEKDNSPPAIKTDTAVFKGLKDLRGKRYCEIWVVSGSVKNLLVTVYNTIGCNDCPEDIWKKFDKDKLRDSLKVKTVLLNGPRVFVLDKLGFDYEVQKPLGFQRLQVTEVATMPVTLKMVMHGKPKPFHEHALIRKTNNIYEKGKKVYKLISPKHVYIMQSYFAEPIEGKPLVLPDNLTGKITLPEGWKFETEVLKEELVAGPDASGKSFILQDYNRNTYLRLK